MEPMRTSFGFFAAIVAVLLPMAASAATLLDALQVLSVFLNAAVGMTITVAILVFFWALIQYLMTSGAEHKGKMVAVMFNGVLALFVMTSIWGIVRLLQNTFHVQSTTPVVPQGVQLNTKYY